MNVTQLRTLIFEKSGISVDDKDPIIAVLIATAAQSEEVGKNLKGRLRSIMAFVVAMSSITLGVGFVVGQHEEAKAIEIARLHWIEEQKDPHFAAVLISKEGRAGIRLAQLGVADLLLKCIGRSSWKVIGHYCLPMTKNSAPDGFKISEVRKKMDTNRGSF